MQSLWEPLMLGIALAMDALAVSVALGASGARAFTWRKIAVTAGFFGAFQMLMPILGWGGGTLCGDLIRVFGRYIAPLLLLAVGINMLREALSGKEEDGADAANLSIPKLFVLALATSIDALAVGVSYACRQHVSVVTDAAVIGIVTALISTAGCVAGRLCGKHLGGKCGILGAVILAGVAVKVFFWG